MKWDIDEAVALGILRTANSNVGSYKGKFTALDTALNEVKGALQHSDLVREGIPVLDQHVVNPADSGITHSAGSAVQGTGYAVGYYQQSQFEMAARSQRAAAGTECPPDMPKAVAKHGIHYPGAPAAGAR